MRSPYELRRGFGLSRFLRALLAVVVSLTFLGGLALAQQAPPPTPPKKSGSQPASGGAAAKTAPAPKVTTKPKPSGTAKPSPSKKPAALAKAAPPQMPASPPEPKYDQRPVDEALSKQARTIKNEIEKMLRAGNIPPDQVQKLEDYYKKYALARWTSTERDPLTGMPVHLTKLPEYRKELRAQCWYARQGPAHDRLIALALPYLAEIAKNENSETGKPENYDPAARCNAMLAIGDLNQRESPGGMDSPTPLPEALPVLVEAFSDPNQHDAVRAAALVGILRHALLRTVLRSIAAGEVRNIQDLMLPLAGSKAAPGRSLTGHLWMRARSIEVLGALEDVGSNNAVVVLLGAIVGEEDGPLLPRRAAARAIGSLSYPAGNGLNPSELAVGLGQLALDACEAELANIEQEKIKERRKKQRMGPGYWPGYGDYETYGDYEGAYEYEEEEAGSEDEGYEDEYGKPKEEEQKDTTLINRRRLLTYLNAVFFGLTGKECKEWAEWKRKAGQQDRPEGVAGLATAAPDQAFVDTLLERVESLSKLCEAKTKEELLGKKEKDFTEVEMALPQKEAFRQRIEDELAQLREVLKNAPAAGAAQPAAGS